MTNAAIIFGSSGQDGVYLSRLLERLNISVVKVDALGPVSLQDFGSVSKLFRTVKPDFIFHFAAKSSTSHEYLLENYNIIVLGSLNILKAAEIECPTARIFLTGSGLQFVNTGSPISELDPFIANSAYSACRINSVFFGRYFRAIGMKVYVGYLFNHDSPLRKSNHINAKIVELAKRIHKGSKEKLKIGDPTVVKEFGFAGEIVHGIWTLVNQTKVFEAVIGTGEPHSIYDWIRIVFSFFSIDIEDRMEVLTEYVPEFKRLISNPSTINSLGWTHKMSIHELAQMMCEK